MTADNKAGDDGGGGINATTNRQTRDKGWDEKGEDGKGKQASAPLSLEKKHQSTFNVGGGNGEVTDEQRVMTTTKKTTTIK
jgi:hypothetical protein